MNGRLYTLIIGLIFLTANLRCQESNSSYKIDVEIVGISDTTLILAHRFGDKFYSDDTLHLDSFGKGAFTGDFLLPEGMYQIVLPDKTFLDFFLDGDQEFKIKTAVPDLVSHNEAIGHHDNQVFFNWHRASVEFRRTPEMEFIWDTTLISLDNTLAGKFLAGIRPFAVPKELLSNKQFTSDQLAQYSYYKSHFFDQVDLNDPRLLRTPLIFNKLNQFLEKVVPPYPDSVSYYCDIVLEKAKSSPEVFRFALQHMLNYYAEPKIMGTDAVYVHLARKYYLNGQADWIDEANLKMIEARVDELKNLLLGMTAPKLIGLQTAQGEAIDPFEEDFKFKVLYFWEPDCGHCKKATPELFQEYMTIKSLGAEVFAINTRDDVEKWESFIAEHELTWINLHSPNNVRLLLESYNAWSTPLIYILDKDNKIIAKDLAVNQVKEFLTYAADSQK